VDDQDRQDQWIQRVLGENLMAGTLRLFLLIGLISAVGGGAFWSLGGR
jgi:hypothetical protein